MWSNFPHCARTGKATWVAALWRAVVQLWVNNGVVTTFVSFCSKPLRRHDEKLWQLIYTKQMAMELQRWKETRKATNQNWSPFNGYLQEANRCLVHCCILTKQEVAYTSLAYCSGSYFRRMSLAKKGFSPFQCKNITAPCTRWPWPKALYHPNCIN